MYFQYGETETNYLKSKGKHLARVIDEVGHINRKIDDDLFSAIVHQIIAQQISAKAESTIWKRLCDSCCEVSPNNIRKFKREDFVMLGINSRKAEYIATFTKNIIDGIFDLETIQGMEDEEAIQKLAEIKGIGRWTAEMILLFGLHRRDILSFEDPGIQKGICMTFKLRSIDQENFEKFRKLFSPYNSVASLYFWEVNAGAIPELSSVKRSQFE